MLKFQKLFLKACHWNTKQSRILKIECIHMKSQFWTKLVLIILIMERFRLEEAWKGMRWMEGHIEILQNSKSWLYSKSSDFALKCSAIREGSKFFFSLSSCFVSLVSSFLLVGWFLLVEFPLNPMHSCSLLVCKTYGLRVFIDTTFRRRVSDFRLKVIHFSPSLNHPKYTGKDSS